MVNRRGLLSPERTSAREKRRAIIDASPARYEVIEGRTWKIVTLPNPGEMWVVEWEYPDRNGDTNSTDPTAATDGIARGNLPFGRYVGPE